jgi:hypothetical protein
MGGYDRLRIARTERYEEVALGVSFGAKSKFDDLPFQEIRHFSLLSGRARNPNERIEKLA